MEGKRNGLQLPPFLKSIRNRSTDMHDTKQVLSALRTGMKAEPVRNSRFTGSVVAVSDDHSRIRVRFCTGSFLDVPTSVLKNLRHLGTAGQNGEHLGLVVGDIDTSSDAGVLIQQMGLEITRLSQLMPGSSTAQGAENGQCDGPRGCSRPEPDQTGLGDYRATSGDNKDVVQWDRW